MTFALNGTTITQTGTDTDLTGLSGITGVEYSEFTGGAYSFRQVTLPVNHKLVVEGDLTIDANTDMLVIPHTAGNFLCLDIAASGSLTVQDFVTDGTNTIYSQKRALHILNQTDNHWNPNQGIVVSGDLIMNGAAIIASSHINFFAGGTFTVDGESVLALGDAISGSSNLFRFSNSAAAVSINGLISQGGANAFESAVFSRLDGYAPQFMGAGIMAVGDVDLVGYNPQNCDMDIEFGNVNNNGSRYTIHGYADKAVTASIHSAYTTAPDAWAKVMKELNLTLLDEANAPVPDGVCYFKDTDHGARYNKVQDLTGDIIYTGTSDASGQMQHDILLANVQHGVSDVLPLYSDPRPVDYRTKNNSHDYKMDVAVCSYNHLPRIASDVDLTGLDRSVDLSMILSADASITEADPDVVAGYGEIPTAAEIYDAGKLWLVNNYEGQSATLVTKEGDSKVVMASDVVVDPSDSIISDVLWTQLDNLPVEEVSYNTSQVLADGKIWMTGGRAGTTRNLQFLGTYDSAAGIISWAQLDNLPVEDVRSNISQILSDGKIWMTGGIADTTDNLQFLGTYDSAAGSVSWVQLDNLPVEDVYFNTSQILSDGKIWMTGGYADTTDNLQFLGTYDSAAGSVSWVQLDNLPVEDIVGNTSQVLSDGKIWMTGGIADTTDNLQFLGTYDSAAGSVSWVQLDNLPVEDIVGNTSQVLSDGKIWMTGGIADTTDNLQFLGTYDSAAGSVSWVQLDNLPVEEVSYNTSQVLADGKIWMTGGIADTTDNLQFLGTYFSNSYFDTATNQTVAYPFNGFHYDKANDRIQIRANDLTANVQLTGDATLTLENGATMSGALQDAGGDSLITITTAAGYDDEIKVYLSNADAESGSTAGLISSGSGFRYNAADYGGQTLYVRMETASDIFAIATYDVPSLAGIYEALLLTTDTATELADISSKIDALTVTTRNIAAATL